MCRYLKTGILFFCLYITAAARPGAAENRDIQIKGSVINQFSTYALNYNSMLNPSNLYSLGSLSYYLTGDLVFKSAFGENSKGAIKLEARYCPVSPYTTNSGEYIFIKEIYLDMIFDFMAVKTGKQFIKWDEGIFFYPIDVVNMQRDPLKPLNQAEGNPFIEVLFPFQSYLSLEILSLFKPGETTNFSTIPFIPRISFDWENLSGFIFTVLEESEKPDYGLNLDYVNSLGENNRLQFYAEFLYQNDHVKYLVSKNDNEFTIKTTTNNNFKAAAGGNISQSLPDSGFVDGIAFYIELLYQQEYWRKDDFNNYIDYTDTVKTNILQHYNSLQYYQIYQNSRCYIFSSVSLQNFIIPNISVNNSTVINLANFSGIYIPEITYCIDTMNMSFSLNGNIFFGGEKTEFANNVFNTAVNFYSQINF